MWERKKEGRHFVLIILEWGIMAYCRPILRSTVERCPLLKKIIGSFFQMQKRLNRGGDENFCTLFSRKVFYFYDTKIEIYKINYCKTK